MDSINRNLLAQTVGEVHEYTYDLSKFFDTPFARRRFNTVIERAIASPGVKQIVDGLEATFDADSKRVVCKNLQCPMHHNHHIVKTCFVCGASREAKVLC